MQTTKTNDPSQTHQLSANIQPSSKEAPSPQSTTYRTPIVTTLAPNYDQYMLMQPAYYHVGSTVDFSQISEPPMPELQAMLTQSISTVDPPHPFSNHYAQIMQQPSLGSAPDPAYIHLQYQSPTSPFIAQQHMTTYDSGGSPLMATYHTDRFQPLAPEY